MKKTLCLFGATIVASTVLTSCSKEEEAAPKNYFGTEPAEAHGTPKEAYYAFFGGLVVIMVVVLWFLKKLGSKK